MSYVNNRLYVTLSIPDDELFCFLAEVRTSRLYRGALGLTPRELDSCIVEAALGKRERLSGCITWKPGFDSR